MVIFRGGADSQGSNVWSRASALIPGQSAFLVASRRGVQLWTKTGETCLPKLPQSIRES